MPGPLGKAKPVVGAYTSLRWGANNDEDAERAREAIVAALDNIESDLPPPPAFDSFRAELSGRPGYRWVEETFRNHR